MNLHIQSPSEFVRSTSKSEFRLSADAPVSSAPLPSFLMELDGNVRPSQRTGRMPRRVELAEREASDKEYAQRMGKARRVLANEFSKVETLNLAQLRLQQGLSQSELARRLKTSQSHIAKIEAGTVDLYLKTAARLADALSISLNDLRAVVEVSQKDEPITSTITISQQ